MTGRWLIIMFAALAGGAGAPIFQPGAPGAPSRIITAEEAVALSRSTFIEADVVFMQHMIVHHAQAVEMVELMAARAEHPGVRRLGERISASQAAEMGQMRAWLLTRGQPLEDPHLEHGHHGHGHHGHSHHNHHGHHGHHDHGAGGAADPDHIALMPGMLTPAQMAALAAAHGRAFDILFLEGMIEHHQGAIDMVDDLVRTPGSAEDAELSDFLSHVVADQSAEILRMQVLLSELDAA
ncbi:MAG: DUF305 domain-containing protein [Oceanicaulis sp.]|nr:DUF305 domain-containing protein [Oceanicaulis sp.]